MKALNGLGEDREIDDGVRGKGHSIMKSESRDERERDIDKRVWIRGIMRKR